jgi:SsrA-binding protein
MQIYATNEKAHFDYNILEKFEAGLVLSGQEVKSVKKGSASIRGCYVKIFDQEAWLLGATIPPYQPGNVPDSYDQQRSRKLLLKQSELKYLIGKSAELGLTIVPIKLYNKNNLIKLEIGLGRGKKKTDKREAITKRETKRKLQRTLKQGK